MCPYFFFFFFGTTAVVRSGPRTQSSWFPLLGYSSLTRTALSSAPSAFSSRGVSSQDARNLCMWPTGTLSCPPSTQDQHFSPIFRGWKRLREQTVPLWLRLAARNTFSSIILINTHEMESPCLKPPSGVVVGY